MSDPSFGNLALGDPYLMVKPSGKRWFKRDTYKTGGHETDWRPAKSLTHNKTLMQSAFEWIKEPPHKKKDMRDPENRNEVMTAPTNILNNPMKVGRVARRGDKYED